MVAGTVVLAGGAAGVLATVSGYLITGRWFHGFQQRTPGTWRAGESWNRYAASTLLRFFACIAIALAYAALASSGTLAGRASVWRGIGFGAVLWAIVALPLVLEVALFVNWHRGFVAGLLLDWLVVAVLAGAAAGLVSGA